MLCILNKKDLQKLAWICDFQGIYITCETEVESLFTQFYRFLGFDKISPIHKPHRQSSYGDYLAWRGDKELRVELEFSGLSFFNHHPKVRERIDVLVTAYIPSEQRSAKWKELREKEVIDLRNYFSLCIIKSSEEELELWEFLRHYEQTVPLSSLPSISENVRCRDKIKEVNEVIKLLEAY